MEEQNQKSKFWKFAVWFVVIVIVAGVVLWVVDYFSPEARGARETQRNYELYQQSISDMEAALRADTYGGATPQETLDLFVAALRQSDVELASKYFALETDTKNPDYLTRNKIFKALNEQREEGKLQWLADQVSKAVPEQSLSLYEGDFGFLIRGDDQIVISEINMELNKQSGVWKIQSL